MLKSVLLFSCEALPHIRSGSLSVICHESFPFNWIHRTNITQVHTALDSIFISMAARQPTLTCSLSLNSTYSTLLRQLFEVRNRKKIEKENCFTSEIIHNKYLLNLCHTNILMGHLKVQPHPGSIFKWVLPPSSISLNSKPSWSFSKAKTIPLPLFRQSS